MYRLFLSRSGPTATVRRGPSTFAEPDTQLRPSALVTATSANDGLTSSEKFSTTAVNGDATLASLAGSEPTSEVCAAATPTPDSKKASATSVVMTVRVARFTVLLELCVRRANTRTEYMSVSSLWQRRRHSRMPQRQHPLDGSA
ncbi:hypothetical protein A6B34_00840 [Mycolicibacterium monacense]|nr:hypothetical protein A6B34_00840 [Mycolicibacterium monacense]